MTSYQKLKARIKYLEEKEVKLLTDQKFYLTECLAYGVRQDMMKRIWFGDSKKPNGKLKGLFFLKPEKGKKK